MRDVTAKKNTVVSLPSRARSRAGDTDVESSTLKLAGNLAGFNLADVVQLIIVTKKTGLLSIKSDEAESLIYFEGGHVIHAEDDERQGEEVAYASFLHRVGRFEFTADILPSIKTLDLDGTFILMEAMRRLDDMDKEPSTKAGSGAGGAPYLSSGADAAQLFGDNAAEQFNAVDDGGPRLSLITNETVLEMDLYRGQDEGVEQALSLSDDLVEALLASSPADMQVEQGELEDGVALRLAEIDWIESFNMFSQNGFPLTNKPLGGASQLGEKGVATVSILEFSAGLGALLNAGELEYAYATEKNNSKTIFAGIDRRYIAARLKPGSPSRKLITKMLTGLAADSSK